MFQNLNRGLTKKDLEIGKNKEFLHVSNNGSGEGFDATEYLTKEFIYQLRVKALVVEQLSHLLWMTLKHIESYGKLRSDVSDTQKTLIGMKMTNIFAAIFGPSLVSFKCIFGWHVIWPKEEGTSDNIMDDHLIPLISLYREEWEPLTKEYEEELMTLDNSC